MQQTAGQLPSPDARINGDEGAMNGIWYAFMTWLATLTATEVSPITVGASPYVYEASKIGHLHVAAGTVSSVVLQRGGVSLPCPTSGFVPVAASDEVTITYIDAPTVTFVPEPRT